MIVIVFRTNFQDWIGTRQVINSLIGVECKDILAIFTVNVIPCQTKIFKRRQMFKFSLHQLLCGEIKIAFFALIEFFNEIFEFISNTLIMAVPFSSCKLDYLLLKHFYYLKSKPLIIRIISAYLLRLKIHYFFKFEGLQPP